MDRIENWLNGLRRKWMTIYFLQVFFTALAMTGAITLFLIHLFPVQHWIFFACLPVVFMMLAFIFPFWKLPRRDLLRYLNRHFAELEDSAELLIKKTEDLSGLETLQRAKVIHALPTFNRLKEPKRKLKWGALALGSAALFCALIMVLEPSRGNETPYSAPRETIQAVTEQVPAQVAGVKISITPPRYTQLAQRTQTQFSLSVETGSLVKWELETTKPVQGLRFIFNGTEGIDLLRLNNEGTRWGLSKQIHTSGFYQLAFGEERSDFYPLASIPDLPPTLTITHPGQHSTIDFGEPQILDLRVSLRDDYGLESAFISATLASGKGEGVSFSEKELPFGVTIHRQRTLNIQKKVDLRALGMKPGDELYFFVKAFDHHGQSSQSEVYVVSLVDTAELMSMGSMSNGVDLVPEYFRSQRQLIIDTERLVREKDTIAAPLFADRSNALGMDQKLLRLRYGKFLGEEFETEIGGDHDHEEDHHPAEEFGNVEALMEKYAHNHDIAEDATFFEPEMKAQLKAVLTEMWSAELQLRVNKPQDALPFEYKALRLLKDLQQQSRVYAAKTTTKVAKLNEDKRLSGPLDEILAPVLQKTEQVDTERESTLKGVLQRLTRAEIDGSFTAEDKALLKTAERYLMDAAKEHPATFLPALKGMKNIAVNPKAADLILVQRAIHRLLIQEEARPQIQGMESKKKPIELYFEALQNAN